MNELYYVSIGLVAAATIALIVSNGWIVIRLYELEPQLYEKLGRSAILFNGRVGISFWWEFLLNGQYREQVTTPQVLNLCRVARAIALAQLSLIVFAVLLMLFQHM